MKRFAHFSFVLLLAVMGGCSKEMAGPTIDPNLILGTWKGSNQNCPPLPQNCFHLCPQFTLTRDELTLYVPGSLQTYACRIEGNQLITTSSLGNITIEYSPPGEIFGYRYPATLQVTSNPPNCNIDGGYSK